MDNRDDSRVSVYNDDIQISQINKLKELFPEVAKARSTGRSFRRP